jgi:hypothetical protein
VVQERPQLQLLIVIHYPEEVFFDSAQPEQPYIQLDLFWHLPMDLDSSLNACGKSTLAASVNAFTEEHYKSRESSQQQNDPYVAQLAKLAKEKLEMQVSRNLDDNVNHLIKIK